jgi:hypothetical protein
LPPYDRGCCGIKIERKKCGTLASLSCQIAQSTSSKKAAKDSCFFFSISEKKKQRIKYRAFFVTIVKGPGPVHFVKKKRDAP